MIELTNRLARIVDLQAAASVLEWDQETYLPSGGTEARVRQVETLRRMAHELLTDDATLAALESAEPANELDADLIRVVRRDVDRATRLPAQLVANLARATGRARPAWIDAKQTDDFTTFQPHLERIVDLCAEKAEAIGYADSPYDALLDEYEPDMRTSTVKTVFGELRKALVPLVAEWASDEPAPIVRGAFDRDAQWAIGMQVMRDVGYDFERGRQDESAHPFTTAFSIHDVRITTRIHPDHFSPGFFGSLHEMGHGLYEQGIDPGLEGTPLADGTSLGFHESQSRLWENLVGRSRPFWERYYPALQAAFPEALGSHDVDAFYRAVNQVRPSLIRIEADEVTYNLHIMVRFELELDLLEGRLAVRDLPEAWNARMEEFLGVRPESDSRGCLQDIHWSFGIFGYFPTYALGNLMSAQLWTAIRRELPDLDGQIRRGEFAPLLTWLREHVHRHGRRRSADRILRDATGHGLRADDWLTYVRQKFAALTTGGA